MKRLAICLLALMLVSTAACGTSAVNSGTAAEPQETSSIASPVDGSTEQLQQEVRIYLNYFAELDVNDRNAIAQLWKQNDFQSYTPTEMIDAYAAYVPREAAVILYFWNAQNCIDYIKKEYAGDPDYLNELVATFEECIRKYPDLENEDLASAFETMQRVSVAEAQRGGTTFIADAVAGYGEAKGAEDTAAFFQMVEDG